jgi:hypothetical protein
VGLFNLWKCQTNEGLTIIASLGVTSNISSIIHKLVIVSPLQTLQLCATVPAMPAPPHDLRLVGEALGGHLWWSGSWSQLYPLWVLGAASSVGFNPCGLAASSLPNLDAMEPDSFQEQIAHIVIPRVPTNTARLPCIHWPSPSYQLHTTPLRPRDSNH